jgi:hypothetical protein
VIDWRKQASCLYLPESYKDPLFFSNSTRAIDAAKMVCDGCPVLDLCREANDQAEAGVQLNRTRLFGVVAGESVSDRIARRKAARKALEGSAA